MIVILEEIELKELMAKYDELDKQHKKGRWYLMSFYLLRGCAEIDDESFAILLVFFPVFLIVFCLLVGIFDLLFDFLDDLFTKIFKKFKKQKGEY